MHRRPFFIAFIAAGPLYRTPALSKLGIEQGRKLVCREAQELGNLTGRTGLTESVNRKEIGLLRISFPTGADTRLCNNNALCTAEDPC